MAEAPRIMEGEVVEEVGAVHDSHAEHSTASQVGEEGVIPPQHYIIVDVGAHLTSKKYARDLDSVVQRARDAGVHKLIVPGTSIHVSKEALRLTRLYPSNIYCTAGVCAHEAKFWGGDPDSDPEDTYRSLRELALNPECVAVGACGLDFHRCLSPPAAQIEVVQRHVQLAKELRMPLVVQEKGANQEMVKLLRENQDGMPPTLLLGFGGGKEEARMYLSLGLNIGVSGQLWKGGGGGGGSATEDEGLRAALQDGTIPLDRMMLSSDAPFMFPNTRASRLPPHVKSAISQRSLVFLQRYCTFQRNEPCSLPATAEMVAAYMQLPAEKVSIATTYNALKVFGLTG